MHRWLLALLATTSLYGIDKAQADVVWASQTGSFGQSFAASTNLAGPSSTVYNDIDQYNYVRGPDYFSFGAAGPGFTLTLTAARAYSDGNGGYYGGDQIDSYVRSNIPSSNGASAEGASIIVATALPAFGSSAQIASQAASASSAGPLPGITLSVSTAGNVAASSSAAGGAGSAATYQVPDVSLNPILTFYDDTGNELAEVAITEGNSIVLAGAITGLNSVHFSVSSPFDYNIQLDAAVPTADVPEPASMAVLGLGAAGAALARCRKRVI